MIETPFDKPAYSGSTSREPSQGAVTYGVDGLPKGDKCKIPPVTSYKTKGTKQQTITSKPTVGK